MRQIIRTYTQLEKEVGRTLIEGQQRIEALKVEVYWKTGKLISDYLKTLPAGERQAVGVLEKLSLSLVIDRSIFFRILKFAETYPEGVAPGPLTWTHYRSLISVPDKVRRKELTQQALKQNWPARRLRHEIEKSKDAKHSRGSSGGSGLLIEPDRHAALIRKIKVYKELGKRPELRVDLGFEIQRELGAHRKKFEEGNFVFWNPKQKKWILGGKSEELYYYEAQVIRVVDGDTLLVNMDLGFSMYRRQYLRLRGLNSEERDSKKGARATSLIEKIVKKEPRLLVRTHLTDRYDRFLADVWSSSTYLNNALLESNLAVKV